MENQRQKRRRGLLLFLVCLLLVAAAAVGFLLYFLGKEQTGQVYTAKLESARKYADSGDYENAVEKYLELIELDEEKPEAYEELAELYAQSGDVENAATLAARGYRYTKAESLSQMYERFLELRQERAKEKETETEETQAVSETDPGKTETGEAVKEMAAQTMMKNFSAFTAADYIREYGAQESVSIDGDLLRVRYQKLAADVYYRNTESYTAFSELSFEPDPAAMPYRIEMDNVREIFGIHNEEGLTVEDMTGLLGKKADIVRNRAQDTQILSFTLASCTVHIACDSQGNLEQGELWNQILLPEPVQSEAGSFAGTVVDAVTGEPLAQSYVELRDENGNVVRAQTDASGRFIWEGAPGTYLATISRDGYISNEREVSAEIDSQNIGSFALSPVLENSEIRIVLEWGAQPADLDAHVRCAFDDGTELEVDYTQMTGVRNGETVVELDVDDRDGYGPETVTIKETDGVFGYVVHDFLLSGQMGAVSNAVVTVYLPDGTSRVFHIPQGEGYYWSVFTIDHGVIKEINTIY